MRRFLASGLALGFAIFVVALARTPAAETAGRVLEACEGNEQEIEASALPGVVGPAGCPVGGRRIVDGGVASVVPPAGESVYVEVLTTTGSEELAVARREDGSIEIERGEDDPHAASGAGGVTASGGSGECSDRSYTDGKRRVTSALRYRIGKSTTPPEIKPANAVDAIRRAGARVADTRSDCRMGDRVPVRLVYEGKTDRGPNIDDFSCGSNDGRSVVSFGNLPDGTLAVTCNWGVAKPGYDDTVASDIKLNKTDVEWTTSPRSRSCQGKWDLEGVMTHERGHTFGLGHVSEADHGYLTMSTAANGTCQGSERSLGRGDVLGLGNKYR